MKKLSPSRRISFIFFAMLLFASTIFFFSCQKDLIESKPAEFEVPLQKTQKAFFTIDEAKESFESASNHSSFSENTAFNPITYLNPQPVWSASTKGKKGNVEFFETPLVLEKTLGVELLDPKKPKRNKNPDIEDLWKFIRLVSVKNANGVIENKYVFIVPEEKYLKSKGKDVNKISFDRPSKDFTGDLLCYNTDGTFSQGWRYDKGRLTGEFRQGSAFDGTLQTRGVNVCSDVCVTWYQTVCTATYGCLPTTIIGQTCIRVCDANASTANFNFFLDGSLITSGGGGGVAVNPLPTTLQGKCITPVYHLCPSSLRVIRENGATVIRMKDFAIGISDVNGSIIAYPMSYVTINTPTEFGFIGLEPYAVQRTFDKIVQDLEIYAQSNNITKENFKPGLKLFPISNGSMGNMGDYMADNFNVWYRVYIKEVISGTGQNNVIYNASIFRSNGDGLKTFYNVVASDQCN